MNPEDDLALWNKSIGKVRMYWRQRADPLVRHWLRSWIWEQRVAIRSLGQYRLGEVAEGARIFRRTVAINYLSHAA
jgi:hypothetical protein